MSRSPILKTLRRAYALAKQANKLGIPVDNILELSLSRRSLIRTSLFGAGLITATAINSCTPPVTSTSSDRVVLIVGAGLAGLTCGYRLAQKGIAVKIIEASDRIGGRIISKSSTLDTPSTAELGGEFIDSGHTNILKLAAEMGLTVVDLTASDRDLTSEIWFFDGRKIEFAAIAKAFMPLAKQIESDLNIIGEFDYQKFNPTCQARDRTSIKAYLQKYCPDPTLQKLISVAYTIEYGREVEEQSALNLILLIGTDTKQLTLFGESDEKYGIAGGNEQLPKRLGEKLAGFIELNSYLESVRSSSDGKYQVSWRQGSSSSQAIFSEIVLAIPFTILRKIDIQLDLPPAKAKAIKEMGYGRNAKLITSYSDRLWRTKYESNGSVFSDLGWQNTWETGRYTKGKSGLITNYLGGNKCLELSNDARQEGKKFVGSFERIFPNLKSVYQSESTLINWHKNPYVEGSYSCYLVGQYTQFHGVEKERFENIIFAGECCSVETQGYMEGACETGEAAAREIMANK